MLAWSQAEAELENAIKVGGELLLIPARIDSTSFKHVAAYKKGARRAWRLARDKWETRISLALARKDCPVWSQTMTGLDRPCIACKTPLTYQQNKKMLQKPKESGVWWGALPDPVQWRSLREWSVTKLCDCTSPPELGLFLSEPDQLEPTTP